MDVKQEKKNKNTVDSASFGTIFAEFWAAGEKHGIYWIFLMHLLCLYIPAFVLT